MNHSEQYEHKDMKSIKIGFIGGGNMAYAIGSSLISKGILNPNNVWTSGRTDKTLHPWELIGTHVTKKNGEIVENCDIIFLAIKPHMLDDALQGVKETLTKRVESKLYISILAGVPLETLHLKLANIVPDPRIIRSMLNIPMKVGEGIIAFCNMKATSEDTKLVETLFSHLGIVESTPESLMNVITGLAGSGPAYAYIIIEALSDGAVRMGISRSLATKFAAQVLVGAGKMVLESGRHPGELKDEICSSGGTTISGVYAIECGRVRASMMNAVEAAVNKANEFSKQASKPI